MTEEKDINKNPTAEGSNTASGSKRKGKEISTGKGEKVITMIKTPLANIYFDLSPEEVEELLEKRKLTFGLFLKALKNGEKLEKGEINRTEAKVEVSNKEIKFYCEKLKIVKIESKREEEIKTKTEIDQQINRTNQLIENAKLVDGENVGKILDKVGEEAYSHYSYQQKQQWDKNVHPADPASTLGEVCRSFAFLFTSYGSEWENIWKNKAKEEVVKSASEIVTRSNNQVKLFAQELLVNKQILIRVKEVMTDKEREAEAKISQLTQEKDEANNKLKDVERKATTIAQTLKEREQKEVEKQKQEKERKEAEAEELKRIQYEKGEIQKALLSAERSEIEQLRAERNQLRTNTEEQEKFLSRWVKQYERLELEKKDVILAHEELYWKFRERGLTINERDSEIREINTKLSRIEIEKAAIEAELKDLKAKIARKDKEIEDWKDNYENMKGERDNWHQQKNQLERQNLAISQQIKELEADKIFLKKEKAELEEMKKKLEADLNKAIHMKRIGMLGNIAQGAIDWLPIPKKWQGGLKTSIQVGSAWALAKDLPNWTYEGLIMLIGVGLWYFVIYFLRKINRFIFGRKDKKQVSNLEQALTNIIEGGKVGKEKKAVKAPASEEKTPTIIIQNSPPVINKEAESKKENLTQISSEKTESKNNQKNGSSKKKKTKKKVKGDSS